MHIEVQVALNFVISYLYNKLPRRRVNIFGEELEKALKDKFQGHWYPEMPFKGSAFRCLKTGDPIDKVLERAARESGVPIGDILENLPQELAVWVDPGEVSYRIGEKGAVKILFSDKADPQDENSADREVTKTFNPEAQCFRPIESVSCTLSALSLSPKSPFAGAPPANGVAHPPPPQLQAQAPPLPPPGQGPRSPAASPAASYKGSPSPVPPAFIPRSTAPLTFTTATFAQTKFGSTKLKTSSKRANRMSPTEFSNYIKQRAMQQQLASNGTSNGPHHSPGSGRALSPDPATAAFYYHHQYGGPHPHQFPTHHHRSMFESSAAAGQFLAPANGDLYGNKIFGEQAMHGSNGAAANGGYYPGGVAAAINTHQASSNGSGAGSGNQDGGKLLENNWPYTATGQYQHLLVAN